MVSEIIMYVEGRICNLKDVNLQQILGHLKRVSQSDHCGPAIVSLHAFYVLEIMFCSS